MKIETFEEYKKALEAVEEYKKKVVSEAVFTKGDVMKYAGRIGRVASVSFNSDTGKPQYLFKPSHLYKDYLLNTEEKSFSGNEPEIEMLPDNPVREFLEELDEVSGYENFDSKTEARKAENRLHELQRMCAHDWKKDGGFFLPTTRYWCEVCGKEVEETE